VLGEITFDDCCRLILEGWLREDASSVQKSYRQSLLELLSKEFGISWRDDIDSRAAYEEGLPLLLSTIPGDYARRVNPFACWFEYTPIPGEMEVLRPHFDQFGADERKSSQPWIALFRDLMLLRFPDAAHRKTSRARLRTLSDFPPPTNDHDLS
jgi:hypothetical protein